MRLLKKILKGFVEEVFDMGIDQVRKVKIKKPEKYNGRFVSLDWNNLGTVLGELKKPTAVKLYLYLAGNKSDYDFDLMTAAYANWQDKSYSNGGKVFDPSTRATINKQIRAGIDELIAAGYMKEISKDNYEFYEIKSEETNGNVSDTRQVVSAEIKTQETNSNVADTRQVVSSKIVSENKQSPVGSETSCSLKNESSLKEQTVSWMDENGNFDF